jgi:hypothetical protein
MTISMFACLSSQFFFLLVYTTEKLINDKYQNESDLKSLKNEMRRLQAMVEIYIKSIKKRLSVSRNTL